MEIRVDRCPDSPLCERKFPDALNFVANADTTSAEDALIGISLEKRGKVVYRKRHPLPGIDDFFNPVLVDQSLKNTFPFFFTPWADHGMVKKDELKLEPSALEDLRGFRDDLHPFPGRGKAGRDKLRFSLFLDKTEAACTKGHEPSIMAEGRDANAGQLGRLKNRRGLGDLHLDSINR